MSDIFERQSRRKRERLRRRGKERERKEEEERAERASINWLISQVVPVTGLCPDQSQEPGALSRSHTCMAGSKNLGHLTLLS